jgi:hypothetical protein
MKHHYLRWIKAKLMAEGFDAPGPESRPLKPGRQVFDAIAALSHARVGGLEQFLHRTRRRAVLFFWEDRGYSWFAGV